MEGRRLRHERKSQHSIRGELEERRMDGVSRIGRGMEGRWMSKGVRFCIETMERGRSVWRMGGGGRKVVKMLIIITGVAQVWPFIWRPHFKDYCDTL